jgi:hypothetical protein
MWRCCLASASRRACPSRRRALALVGNYASLANYTAFRGVLTVFALPN